MKKTGSFFLSFLPLIAAIGIQYMMVFFLLGAAALYAVYTQDAPLQYFNDILSNNQFNTLVMVLFSTLCILLFGMWYYSHCDGDLAVRFKKRCHPLMLVALVLLMPSMQYLTTILINVISTIFPSWLEAYEKLFESAGLTDDIPPLMLFYSIILAPLGEELIFRGVTLRMARRALPFWAANFLQAFLFGVFHMNMLQGCYAFALGLVLGYICERGGSIYYSIFLHFLFNLYGTVLSEYLQPSETAVGMTIFFTLAFLGPIVGLLLFRLGVKRKEKGVQLSENPPIIDL